MCLYIYVCVRGCKYTYVVVFGVWLSIMLESLLYSYTICSLIFWIVLSFICFICHFFIFKMCLCSIYKVLALDLFLVDLIL